MKKWYESKTVWFNVIACVAVIAQAVAGKEVLSPATQGIILTVINFLLRLITKHQIDWSKEDIE